METFLFDKIVFGPIHSRRLGSSLGINLLPTNRKICSFDCIYCECGFNPRKLEEGTFPSLEEVVQELEKVLIECKNNQQNIDSITFAGNGEPTLYPYFSEVMEATLQLRNKYYPQTRVAVLTNATRLNKLNVFNTLSLIDDPILKLDSAIDQTVRLMDRPSENYSIENIIEMMLKMNGNFIVQTMFIKAEIDNHVINNTTDEEVQAWLDMLKKVKPRLVQIYSISRVPASRKVEKIDPQLLESIAERVRAEGIETLVTP